ncbi:MAG: protein kinase, partial [Pseudomonadota bacterium]|nr:protein kinase [Pseudomonadota bacterium]
MTDNRDDKTRLVTGGKSTRNASNSDRKATGKPSGKASEGPAKNDDATVLAGGSTPNKSQRNPDATLVTSQTPLSTPTSSRTGSTTTGGTTPRVSALNNKVIKGRFELVSMLGAGGMGAVYKALDRRKVEASDSDPYVAVKLLNDDFRQHPDAFISLQRESRKSQTLAHPNIVTVYDFDRDRDTVFMTMEFLEGAPLDELLREHPNGLPPEQAESALRDISNALIYAHSHNIIHSDF